MAGEWGTASSLVRPWQGVGGEARWQKRGANVAGTGRVAALGPGGGGDPRMCRRRSRQWGVPAEGPPRTWLDQSA